MGRYIPPDLAGTHASGNQIHRRRAPGTLRADGTQTVRFEMPFAVWCTTCTPEGLVAQGVRFNAVKQRVGSYYSTPIYRFRLKHVVCGGEIEIQTDPQNTRYVVVSGGRARDYGEDRIAAGGDGRPILTVEERERRREDAFANLEDRVADATAAKEDRKRVEELYRRRERDWEDPWAANRRLRAGFRVERKARQAAERESEALRARLGTEMELLPATDEDAARARLIAFGDVEDEEEQEGTHRDKAVTKALFERTEEREPPPTTRNQVVRKKEDRKEVLRRQLVGNTRAAMNPFGATRAR